VLNNLTETKQKRPDILADHSKAAKQSQASKYIKIHQGNRPNWRNVIHKVAQKYKPLPNYPKICVKSIKV